MRYLGFEPLEFNEFLIMSGGNMTRLSFKSRMRTLEKTSIAFFLMLTGKCFCQGNLDGMNYAPELSPDGKYLLYYGRIEGNWDIYVIDLKNNYKRRLTKGLAFDGEPSWSPDGKFIVFTSDRNGDDDIYVLDTQTDEIKQITDNTYRDGHPTFSSDGKKIIYQSKIDNQWRLRTIKYLDDKATPILFSKLPITGRMRWSTNRTSLSFISKMDDRNVIYRIDGQGKQLSITFIPFQFAGNPCFSDETKRFVFDAHRENEVSSGDGKWELFTLEITGEKLTQLTNDEFDNWGAVWSKGGNKVFFAGGGFDNKGYQMKTYDIKTGKMKQLTFSE